MKPVLVYDGDCGFCRYWVERWQGRVGDGAEFVAYQDRAGRFDFVSQEAFSQAVHLIISETEVYQGAEAVFRLLSLSRGGGLPARLYDTSPLFARVTETCYRAVASNRGALTFLTRLFWGLPYERSSYGVSRWLFLRNLGLIFALAFLSLSVQITGLVGENGILPFTSLLDLARDQLGFEAYWQLPSIFWLDASDGTLQGVCIAGFFVSLLVVAGIATPVALACAWFLYLSLVHAGQDFLSFQWDILLLECSFLAIFFAPMTLGARMSRERPPSKIMLLLLYWLLFRLMFASGIVKLDDETWRNLTALTYHYETQPLPTRLGWLAHQFPLPFQKASIWLMFFIELAVPFFIVAPRRLRHLAGLLLIALQLLIILTGNYAFFNWLTIGLCLLLFDDRFYRRLAPSRFRQWLRTPEGKHRWGDGLKRYALRGFAVVIVTLSSVYTYVLFFPPSSLPAPLVESVRWTRPFYLANGYGLFAHMTTSRPEIVVEGSNDNETWIPYEFRWKPGHLSKPPRQVAPHQPRLDWQMWFAALGDVRRTPWFSNFMVRLLQGKPEVLALLESNPFPEGPPRYVRAVLWDYHFSNIPTRREKGEWWRRDYRGVYARPMALR